MKALRYLLIVIATVSFLSVSAQGLAQQPQTQMHSTSTMVGSGSTLPSAAVQGAYITGNIPGSYTPADAPGRPRKGWGTGEGGGSEGGEPGDWHEPWEDPIGDAMWPLMLLACAYLIIRATRRRALSQKGDK